MQDAYLTLLPLQAIHTANRHGRVLLMNHLRYERHLSLIGCDHRNLVFWHSQFNLPSQQADLSTREETHQFLGPFTDHHRLIFVALAPFS